MSNNSEPKPLDSRMAFVALPSSLLLGALFIIFTTVTGKAGVAQKMQQICNKRH